MNDNREKLDVLEFEVFGELSQYTDSLLFDNETIARLKTKEYTVTIEVIGDIKIFFHDDVYKCSANFPNELKEIIKNGKVLEHSEVEIIDNNWFEIDIYERNKNDEYELIYDEVFEEDVSTMDKDKLKEYMIHHLKDYLEKDEIELTDTLNSNNDLDISI